MPLSPQEQAALQALLAKQNEPEAAKEYTSVAEVVEYLVRTSDKFSANPEEKEAILKFLDGEINGTADNAEIH